MIVDDNPHFVGALKFILETSFEDKIDFIIEASNGVECLDILSQNPVDLIFMDIDMPEMNGIETTKNIVDKYRDIKIVAVTFHSAEEYLVSMIEAGARGFISKSNINKKKLEEVVFDSLN